MRREPTKHTAPLTRAELAAYDVRVAALLPVIWLKKHDGADTPKKLIARETERWLVLKGVVR